MIHFKPEEFQGFYNKMDPELLIKLDFLREIIGQPIQLSTAKGAIWRISDTDKSQHNLKAWGNVRAVDGYIPEGISYLEFFNYCKQAQFTGIGLYKGWAGGPGFHVDVRKDRDHNNPATWSSSYINVKSWYRS